MNFSIEKSLEILERTPATLVQLLSGLSDAWTRTNEGGDSWSVFDVIGHLIHGEETDWIPRAEIILSANPDKKFSPFDRFAQFEKSKGKSLEQLLEQFQHTRQHSLERLKQLNISEEDLSKTGIHPVFQDVTLSQLLSTWVVHDLNHLGQVARIMASQYREQTGPWIAFLKILRD